MISNHQHKSSSAFNHHQHKVCILWKLLIPGRLGGASRLKQWKRSRTTSCGLLQQLM
jgi:hypothetical protein